MLWCPRRQVVYPWLDRHLFFNSSMKFSWIFNVIPHLSQKIARETSLSENSFTLLYLYSWCLAFMLFLLFYRFFSTLCVVHLVMYISCCTVGLVNNGITLANLQSSNMKRSHLTGYCILKVMLLHNLAFSRVKYAINMVDRMCFWQDKIFSEVIFSKNYH